MQDKLLLVIALHEARNFPKRHKFRVVAEGRFLGDQLSTDPVSHAESPLFEQELAWELNKTQLHRQKLQRSVIKLNFYAVHTENKGKESIGYVVLDIRSGQLIPEKNPKWYPILQSKYAKTKPEIRIALYIDDGSGAEECQKDFKATGAPLRQAQDDASSSSDTSYLRPIMKEKEGCVLIGSEKLAKEMFILTVSIASAKNLVNLVPTSALVGENEYFFYYSLLENDVTTTPFRDLVRPNFPAERASVRIKTSVDTLRRFFAKQPGIEVMLCCGERTIGSCLIPLKDFLQRGSTEVHMKPIIVEEQYRLEPNARWKDQIPAPLPESVPSMSATIILRKEVTQDMANVEVPSLSPMKTSAKSPEKRAPANEDAKYSDDFDTSKTDEDLSNMHSEKADRKSPSKPMHGHADAHADAEDHSLPTTDTHSAPVSHARHYCLSIDLRSIANLDVSHPVNLYLKYTYPFLGSSAPIITHPTIQIARNTEVLIPHSFCAFDFAATSHKLNEHFSSVPLMVEVWHKDDNKKDLLIGIAKLPLNHLVIADRSKVMGKFGQKGDRQLVSQRIFIASAESRPRKIGEIHTVLTLDDFGPVPSQFVRPEKEMEATCANAIAARCEARKNDIEAKAMEELEDAVYELQKWKEMREKEFEMELKEKEKKRLKELAEAFKARDLERETLSQKKLAEYSALETKLRKTLEELHTRERQLSANESEVMRLKTDLKLEHERTLLELREASKRVQEQCDHVIHLERGKTRSLEDDLHRMKQQMAESERKVAEKDREFASFKDSLHSKPEVKLQAEINVLLTEKTELEKKLEAAVRSKLHYKQQWGKALKELAKFKQRESENERARLRKQEQEIEHMRLRYLAAEERDVMDKERHELDDIKNEVNMLREIQDHQGKKPCGGRAPIAAGDALNGGARDPYTEEHIARLIEERDTLLRTGVYTHHDKIIIELEREIREGIAKQS